MKKIISGVIAVALAIAMFVISNIAPIKILGKWIFAEELLEKIAYDVIPRSVTEQFDDEQRKEWKERIKDAEIGFKFKATGKLEIVFNVEEVLNKFMEEHGGDSDNKAEFEKDGKYSFDGDNLKISLGDGVEGKTGYEFKKNELILSDNYVGTLKRKGFFSVEVILKIGGIVLGVIGVALILTGLIGGKKKALKPKHSAAVISPSAPAVKSVETPKPAEMPKAVEMPKPAEMPKAVETPKATTAPAPESPAPGTSRLKGSFKRAEDGNIITPARENGEANMETAGDL